MLEFACVFAASHRPPTSQRFPLPGALVRYKMCIAETPQPVLRGAPYGASAPEVFPSVGIFPELFLNMTMSRTGSQIFEFGPFSLNAAEHTLQRDGRPVPLRPKVFDILLALVERRGHLVGKDELMQLVWPEQYVEEGNLNKTVSLLRLALGEGGNGNRYIETVPTRGYRFVAEVRAVIGDTGVELLSDPPAGAGVVEEETEGETVSADSGAREGQAAVAQPDEETEALLAPVAGKLRRRFESKAAPSLARYISAAFIIITLAAVAYVYFNRNPSPIPGRGKTTIAVLPLKPIKTENRDSIYELGIAESLILKLSTAKNLVVRPLSATRKYSDIEQDPTAAGREQEVDFVLSSNYQMAEGRIRVTSQLINVQTGQIEETYKSEKDSADVFLMQDAIANELGSVLLARFGSTANMNTAKRGTTNEEAYRLYLQGRNLTYNRTAAAARKAVEYFEQATRLDPNFALAYSGIAHSFIASGNLGGDLPREEYEKARGAVNKALELDNNLAEGYAVLGELKFTYEWDFIGAEKDLLRAIELEPNSDLAHQQYAFYLAVRGRFDEAIAESKMAQEINPGSLVIQQHYGVILYLARRYDDAIVQLKRIIEVDENFGMAYAWLQLVYQMKGDDAGAYEWFMKFQKRKNPEHIELFQHAYQTSSWRGVRQKQLELQKLDEQKPSANLYAMARQCALLGEKEQAFEFLNKAFEKHQGQIVMLNVEPSFDVLRDNRRFAELVVRVGLK